MHPVLCMVTDRSRLGEPAEERLVEAVGLAARAGVQLVQLRERGLEAAALVRLAARCVASVRGTKARVLVNDRADVAIAAGAHGVHLPGRGLPARRLRSRVPPGFLIGRSIHEPAEAVAAVAEGGLDYLIFGAVFPTGSKPDVPPAGVGALRTVATSVGVPVLAIGGVTLERLREVAGAGASGFAAIGLFADACRGGQGRVEEVVTAAARAFDEPREVL